MSEQRGYALVLGVLGSAVLLMWWAQLHLVGKRLDQAHQLRVALDSAAYSGGVVQSRTLNALSLLNRAYIGHQIVTAHLVSLAAWAQFAEHQARQGARANPPAWLIGSFFRTDYARAYQAAQRAPALIHMRNALRTVHAQQQQFTTQIYAHFIKDMAQQSRKTRNQLIEDLLHKNLTHTLAVESVDINITADDWQQVTDKFSVQSAVQWVRDLQRHYAFLKQRTQTIKSMTPVSRRCPHLRHQLRRIGSTQIDDKGRWSAHDSLSFHALRSNRWIGCYYREYAMGWAWQPVQEAEFDLVHSKDAREGFGDLHFWRWVERQGNWDFLSEGANPLANSYAVRDGRAWAAVPFQALDKAVKEHYGFRIAAHALLDGQAFHAQSAAQSQFVLPPGHRWQRQPQGDEQSWYPFWTTALMSYE